MTAFCHRCQRETDTIYLPLSSGHIGNCCAECRTARRGHPYVSKHEKLKANTAAGGKGPNDERK